MRGLALVVTAGMFGCGDAGNGVTAAEGTGTATSVGPTSATDGTVTSATDGTASTPTTGDPPTTGVSQGQTQSTGTSEATSGSTTDATATGMTGMTGMTGTTGTTTTDAVTTSATGFLSMGETDASDTTGPPSPPPEAAPCVAYYNTILACFPDKGTRYAAQEAAYCDMLLIAALRADGQPCADAIASYFTCLSELSCVSFGDDELHGDAEGEAIIVACPTTFE